MTSKYITHAIKDSRVLLYRLSDVTYNPSIWNSKKYALTIYNDKNYHHLMPLMNAGAVTATFSAIVGPEQNFFFFASMLTTAALNTHLYKDSYPDVYYFEDEKEGNMHYIDIKNKISKFTN